MAEPQKNIDYMDHDVDVLRELIRIGRDSGQPEPLDLEEFFHEADAELNKERDRR
jgi:Arc/MetJ-type ribon-helix-helix transcriptional regulator